MNLCYFYRTITETLTYPSSKTITYTKAGEIIRYIFNEKDQIEEVYSNRTSNYFLLYDPNGQIFAIRKNSNKTYFIASDYNGTPIEIFDEFGVSQNRIQRSQSGLILNEINPEFYLPIGFHGEFEIHGIVLFKKRRPYDTHLNQWMTPDLDEIIKNPENWKDITKIHPYRYFFYYVNFKKIGYLLIFGTFINASYSTSHQKLLVKK